MAVDPKWVPVAFLLAAALVKGVMGVLDKSGALEKLPPWMRPQITALQSALVGMFAAMAGGTSAPESIMVALSVMGISHHIHATKRGMTPREPS